MSLINEALKKAQRLRTEDAADVSAASYSGGTHVSRRGKPDRANTMVLIGSGALVLVVLSVVFTVYLVNRPASPTQVAAVTPATVVKKTTSAPVVHESATAPAIIPPVIAPAITSPSKDPVGSTTVATAAPASSAPAPSTSTAQPISVVVPPVPTTTPTPPPSGTATAPVTPAPAPAVPALAPDAPDERIAAFVESVRVTGIRSSGTESRVLMNERVYRVNDVVERTMNIRLVKAAPESLTFVDARGVTYVKRL